jgi:hypothetical protein
MPERRRDAAVPGRNKKKNLRMEGERVDTAFDFVGQQIVDEAVAGDAALPFEGLRNDINSKMCFFTPLMSGVASMLIGFVENPQAHGSEGFGQLL